MLSNAELDALLAEAGEAESAGRVADALGVLTVATAEMLALGKQFQYPFEWMARLESALGDHEAAERAALVGRAIAEEASHRPGMFRMDVMRAEIARIALDLPRAETLLADLAGDGASLGPPVVERLPSIVAWLRALRFREHPRQNLGVLRVEVALVIAELWSEQGRYRSALRILAAVEQDLVEAEVAVRSSQVRLLRAELFLQAGDITGAARLVAALPPPGHDLDRIRIAIASARIALAAGRLAEAVEHVALLAAAPAGDPPLYASAIATRIAVLVELNLLDAAKHEATGAIEKLAAGGAPAHLIVQLERARSNAAARGRSAIALWEVPFTTQRAQAAPPPIDEPAGTRSSFAAAWTEAANRVLDALERGEPDEAAGHQARLEQLAGGVESETVAARVELSAALVAYYRGDAEANVARFLAIADRLKASGARLAEAQAVRFAAWAAVRRQQLDDYAALADRTSALVDEIATELDPMNRRLFLLNKWSGRDELVSARVRDLLREGTAGRRRPSRRALCRAFREIDKLTHWPIDDALGDLDAAALAADATPDVAMAWVREQLESVRLRASAHPGVEVRSLWSLWRFPARTLVLHYHVLPDRTYLFRIARRHIDLSILPIGRIHLTVDMQEAASDEEQLRWLATQTGVADAIAQFSGIDRLVIVPHDAIANVPFAALPIGGRRLCAAVPITQLDRLGRLQRRRTRPRRGSTLSVGRTEYRDSGLSDLPSAEREAAAVLAALGEVGDPRRGATRQSVVDALPGAARFHIAAHGLFDMMDPSRSGIVLGDGSGGFETLTLHELRRMNLRGLQLATLATCRSAAHARLPGRERVCLPTAFLDAGTRGVIASMWPVEDEPSVEIMSALYEELRSRPAADALAAMQTRMAARCPARHWAGLVFYGNE